MKHFLFFSLLTIFSCKPLDHFSLKKVGMELGCSGTISCYRTEVKSSQIHHYSKYLEMQLDCPNLFEKFDTATLLKVAAYRLYLNLNDKDKRLFPVIRVIFKNDIKSNLDKTNFFTMSYLKGVYENELIVRRYMKAIKNNDTAYLKNAFDESFLGHSDLEIDSINNSFLKITKGEFDESRVYNWAEIKYKNSKTIAMVFLTGTDNNYSTSFQFALHDSIMDDKNIISINF